MEDIEAKRVNGRVWLPGQSGNPHGRPIGARGRFSERFVSDLTTAWEQHGETALAETAKLYPDRFVAIASHLIPKDVSVSLTASLPQGLDADDWRALVGLVQAIRQRMPDGSITATDACELVGRALDQYQAKPIVDVSLTAATT